MILPICYYGDLVLRKKAQPILEMTDEIRQFAKDLTETMYHYSGVGLAATQVGKLLRIFVMIDEKVEPDGRVAYGPAEVFINPILSSPSADFTVMSEGCLSIPGLHADVMRPSSVRVHYQTLDNRVVEETAIGFRSRVIMHENDHLNGTLFIDRLEPELRKKIDPMLRAIKKTPV